MKQIDLEQIELYLSSGNGIRPDRVSVRVGELSALIDELKATRAALAKAEARIGEQNVIIGALADACGPSADDILFDIKSEFDDDQETPEQTR